MSSTAIISMAATKKERIRSLSFISVGILAVLLILYWGRLLLITTFTSMLFAFVLEPFVALLMRIRFPRNLAALTVCAVAIVLLYLIGLDFFSQISNLSAELPRYADRMRELVDDTTARVDATEEAVQKLVTRQPKPAPVVAPPAKRSRTVRTPVPPVTGPIAPGTIPEVRIYEDQGLIHKYILPQLGRFYQYLLMASFVPFLVYFMLSWWDHTYTRFLQLFSGADRAVAARTLQGIGEMIRAFVLGNTLLGVVIAVSTSLAFLVVHVPYPLLVGSLSGFLSLVPYVGLPLAVIPPLLASLAGEMPVPSILLAISIVAALHLFALNFLYAKVVGARVHLNPLVVTLALMFWSFIWDAPGLILAVPLTAAIKAVCDNVQHLRPIGRLMGD